MQTAISGSKSRKILPKKEKDYRVLTERKNDKKISEKAFLVWVKKIMQKDTMSFRESVKQDLEMIEASVLDFSNSKIKAKNVLRFIIRGIQDFTNSYFLGLISYFMRIAEACFYFYSILGGSHMVYFQVDKLKKEKIIFYIKPSKTNYTLYLLK